MSTLIQIPEDHNYTTLRYKRQSSEAFLRNAAEAQAIHRLPKKPRPGRWQAAIIIGLVLITLLGCAKTNPQPIPVSQERAIPKGVCAKGNAGIWIDSSTITCHKEIK